MQTEYQDIQQLIKDYSPDYCQALELAYGDQMMSEEGIQGLQQFFTGNVFRILPKHRN